MNLPHIDFSVITPELIVIATALVVMLAEFVGAHATPSPTRSHRIALIALLGLVLAALAAVAGLGRAATDIQGMLVADDLGRYLELVVLLAAALGLLLAWDYLPQFTKMHSEYYALYLLAVVGMMFMGKSTELITLFVSLEILSVALYVLTGFHRGQLAAGEAALKYFLLGAFSSAFFIYGAALLYGDTGSTHLVDIAARASGGFLTLAGLALLLVGFGFKLAVVPFHMWTPDVYQGAPTPVTAFMSVGTKAAAFVALFRVLQAAGVSYATWSLVLALLATLTMTWGNLAALRQSSLKRMLAYSSIAHAGYMLIGVTAGMQLGLSAVLFYLFAYAFMNIGAFAVVSLLERPGYHATQDATIDAARGLFARKPLLAVVMAIFLLSLAGVPPLAGFFGKLYLFNAAVQSGWIWLAIVGMINSVVSAYYYLRVTVLMFMTEADETSFLRSPLSNATGLAIAVAMVGTLLLGIFAGPWLQQLGQAALAFAGS
ncbi:MAG: NADH-quinone oxidoreductase subunit N [Chloroflexi bacterium]|nr:NADH-quinone oxidoreductase subunit N [Chloroflexota bacterium]